MRPSSLRVQAGQQAYTRISQHGLQPDDISLMLGASGGPKWFVLYGLDRYLAGEFFQGRTQPLQLLGSSAGAWRFGCLSQQDPVGAIDRFAKAYSTLCYPKDAGIDLITSISATVMDAIYPTDAEVDQVLHNPLVKLNLIVARQHQPHRPEPRQQLKQLLLAAGANLLSPRLLHRFYQRVVFSTPDQPSLFAQVPHELQTLTRQTLRPALMASGSIPLVMHPVLNPAGLPQGAYLDGGILDYHISLPLDTDGLILYPHFYPYLVPGWFDKSLKWRRSRGALLSKTVLLSPSTSWVQSLSLQKIPDRKDFSKLTDTQRLSYWAEVLEKSHQLAEDLKQGNYQLELLR
ncbi:patatin-like phospholipase family protein [Rheinheimera sp.]|uniref:patatin-like phospholipase family protein n=1 Tax=Rheinheimera sp. TaxID=1869214 RepID=UPI003AF7D689